MALGESLGGIIGGVINLADPPQGSKKYAKQALGLWRDLPEPEYDDRDIPWQQLLLAGEITPEIYEAVVTGDVAQIQEDPQTREAQLRAMLGMEQVSREGLPLQDRLLAEEAQRAVGSEFGRANDAIMQNLAARGRAGGGSELAARLAASGAAAEMARGMGSDLAQQSVGNRLMALREAERMGGSIRGQDVQTANLNAQMQNRYNEWLSNLRTQAAQNAAQSRQAAQNANLQQRQRLSDANILGRMGTAQQNQARRNDLQDRLFRARTQKVQGQTGALQGVAQAQLAREQAKAENIKGVAGGVGGIVDSVTQLVGGGYGG